MHPHAVCRQAIAPVCTDKCRLGLQPPTWGPDIGLNEVLGALALVYFRPNSVHTGAIVSRACLKIEPTLTRSVSVAKLAGVVVAYRKRVAGVDRTTPSELRVRVSFFSCQYPSDGPIYVRFT